MTEVETPLAADGLISTGDLAKLLMFESPRRVQQLTAEGYIERVGAGRYDLRQAVQGYIRFLKTEKASKTQTASQARMHDARARDFEIKNARADHTLVEMVEAEAVIDEIAGYIKTEMSGIAATVTRDIPLRRKIEASIDGVFARSSARIAETLSTLRASGESLAPDAEEDA